MNAPCPTCLGYLADVDLIVGATSCVECARRPLLAALRKAEGDGGEWSTFVAAVRAVAREDGTVHQCDMRPRLRGVVESKHVGTLYRRAKSEGLLRDTGEREPSDDVAGRNSDKLDRIYALGRAA